MLTSAACLSITQLPNFPITQSLIFLELARVLLGPALNHNFLVGVKLDGVPALTMEIAEKTVLPPAEREVGHGRGNSDVDADVAGGRLVAEPARGCSARCE